MIVTPAQMKAAEEAAFAQGQTAENLMEMAGLGVAECIRQFFPNIGTLIVYCGKGNNGGDALVSARHLRSWGWRIHIRLTTPASELAHLTRVKLEAFPESFIYEPCSEKISNSLVLLDGLLGTGGSVAPRGLVAERILEMNELRLRHGGFTVAIDLPSGLDGSTGEVFEPCVQADLTITLGFVKSGLLEDSAQAVVGRLALVTLPDLVFRDGGDQSEVLTSQLLRPLLPIRKFDTHKGTYGRIGILAGARGTLGAARLCSAAAVRSGAGLVTLYATPDCYELLASLCIPEVMVKPITSYREVLGVQHDALAVGPGLGREYDDDILSVIREAPLPCIVDADALNAVSTDPCLLKKCAGPRLLTPHPGEMERLYPQHGRKRRRWAEEFVSEYPVTLLLKGSRTVITEQRQLPVFNTTGNPGMGSGGMGDALTGVCAALIGGGQGLRDAAMTGAWLCGRAAEIAIFEGSESQESLSASSIIKNLGAACHSLRKGDH